MSHECDGYMTLIWRFHHTLREIRMISSHFIRGTVAAAALFAIVGLGACTSTRTGVANQALGYGQETTLHTSQGETGSPHGHGSTAVQQDAAVQMGAGSAPTPNVTPSMRMGQESTTHTPQGETGSPHRH